MKRIGTNGGRFINPVAIYRIMNIMKENPKKIFTMSELWIDKKNKGHLILLKKLGLIEQTDYYYDRKNRNGTYVRLKSGVKGWRLK